jgi:hypothetical protein
MIADSLMKALPVGVMILWPFVGFSGAEGERSKLSDRCFAILHAEKSSFWSTAESNVLDVPIRFPSGARSAVLRVEGVGYSKVYSGIAANSVSIVLPEATDESAENLYTVTLEFDNGASEQASFALPVGSTSSNEMKVSCRLDSSSAAFKRARNRALIALPPETSALAVNGENVYLSDGAEWRWLMLNPILNGVRYVLSHTDLDGVQSYGEIVGRNKTFAIVIK